MALFPARHQKKIMYSNANKLQKTMNEEIEPMPFSNQALSLAMNIGNRICIMKSGVPTCVCREGRTGEDCKQSVYTICDLQCENDGRCMSTISGKKCECQPGWTGTLCNQRMKSNAKTPVLSILFLAIFIILMLVGI